MSSQDRPSWFVTAGVLRVLLQHGAVGLQGGQHVCHRQAEPLAGAGLPGGTAEPLH